MNDKPAFGVGLAIAGAVSMVYANYVLVNTATVMTLLVIFCCGLRVISERLAIALASGLAFVVTVSKWWMWQIVAAEVILRTRLALLAVVALLAASLGILAGSLISRRLRCEMQDEVN